MGNKGYHSYRGRRGGWKLLAIVLLTLVLMAACVYLFLQRYMTFTDSGEVRLDLPFFQKEETGAPEGQEDPDAGDMNLVIDDAPGEGEEDAGEGPAAPYGDHRLAGLAALPADGAALEAALSAQGANGFVYTVKDNTGRVFYASAVALRDAVAGGPDSALLEELCGGENVISVARLNCFHDSYYAFAHMESAGICQSSGYIWYDNLSYHWLDPAKEQARSYIIDLALECARLGFDELLLEDMCYPFAGKVEKIDYSGNPLGKSEALVLFLTELKEALAPYDVRVALLLDENDLAGENAAVTGLDLAAVLPLVDAVYARAADPAAAEAAIAAAAGEKAPAFVPVTEESAADGDWYLP